MRRSVLSDGDKRKVVGLWDKHSLTALGLMFGVTRGVISGVIDRHFKRIGLRTQKPRPVAARPRPRRQKAKRMTDEPKRPKMVPASKRIVGIPFLDATSVICKWPLWDDDRPDARKSLICGAKVDTSKDYAGPYCPYHRGVSRGYPVLVCEEPDAQEETVAAA